MCVSRERDLVQINHKFFEALGLSYRIAANPKWVPLNLHEQAEKVGFWEGGF